MRVGYGDFWLNGDMVLAHRAAYELLVGPIPDGMRVLHRCDNPPCVNPEHLWVGTDADNVADMVRKGRNRSVRGEAAPRAKLNDAAVRAIRATPERAVTLARRYGVAESTISAVRHRVNWKHVH